MLSSKSLCLQITAEVSKIMKSVSCNLAFIFIELSGTANSFLKICLVLEIKNNASFIKRRFYLKRGCIKMCKYAKTFDIRKGLQTGNFCFYTNLAVLKIEICSILFKCYLDKNEALHTPTFNLKMNHFSIVFHMT